MMRGIKTACGYYTIAPWKRTEKIPPGMRFSA